MTYMIAAAVSGFMFLVLVLAKLDMKDVVPPLQP